MAELEQGTIIKLLNGKTCTVDSELGRGGQGIVYLVDYCGGDFALKWYTRDYSDSFYNNLKRNADSGAPSNAFLWPLAVTEKQKGSFGYIMKLRPRGYREFSDFMLAKVQFSSMAANINAAIKICDAFQKLHIRGLSYQDMNDGNFFINPKNGDVLICDNDNVAPDKTNLGIIGKAGKHHPQAHGNQHHNGDNFDQGKPEFHFTKQFYRDQIQPHDKHNRGNTDHDAFFRAKGQAIIEELQIVNNG